MLLATHSFPTINVWRLSACDRPAVDSPTPFPGGKALTRILLVGLIAGPSFGSLQTLYCVRFSQQSSNPLRRYLSGMALPGCLPAASTGSGRQPSLLRVSIRVGSFAQSYGSRLLTLRQSLQGVLMQSRSGSYSNSCSSSF